MPRAVPTLIFATLALLLCTGAFAAENVRHDFPPGLVIPPGAQWGPDFDVTAATDAYMNLLSPQQRARSDAYFDGGCWLQLWGYLYSLGVAWLLLARRRSASLRNWCERVTRRRWLRSFLYAAAYIVLAYVLTLPLTIYADFFREHAYGLANQTFGPWFAEQLTGLAVTVVAGALFLTAAYAFVARFINTWWLWLSAFTVAFLMLLMLVAPIWVMPLFNDFKPLADGAVKSAVLGMAHGDGVPADNVYWFDQSKQTDRVSANVSGFLGTTRVSLNDNLLNKTSLPEIKAVMGHELGHYVLNHSLRGAIYYSLIFAVGYALINWSAGALIIRWRERFGLRDLADPAALPLVVALFSTYLFLATPFTNSITRGAEHEADIFGLNTAREPYGFAYAAMRLSSYRKLQPGPIEEFIFFDHPSGYRRVYDSMRWLKENAAVVEHPGADAAPAVPAVPAAPAAAAAPAPPAAR
jgi:STE24 endopeptidase